MKKYLVSCLIIIALAGSTINSYATHKMPGYRTVVKKFFSTYEFNPDSISLLNFAKTRAGWSVYSYIFDTEGNYAAGASQIFWSAESGEYKPIDRKHSDDGSYIYLAQKFLDYNEGNIYGYYRLPYYGYKGWDKDIIAELGSKEHLSDIELEALARAYANLAQSALSPQYSFMNESDFKPLKFGQAVTEDRIRYFMNYIDKDLDIYWKLYRQNPAYETVVGNVYAKLSAEYVYAISTMYMYGWPGFAKKYERTDLFTPYNLMGARNMMAAVWHNGIIFCNGDMDTYTLWYLQEVMGERRDVTVVNISLLGVPFYVNAIQKNFMHEPIVHTRFDSAALVSHFNDYYYIDRSLPTIDAAKLLDALAGKTNSTSLNTEGNQHPHFSGNISLAVIARNAEHDSSLFSYKRQTLDSIHFSFPEGTTYCYFSDIVCLDIIEQNNWIKPVYGSGTSFYFPNFTGYRAGEPYVVHLLPFGVPDSTYQYYNKDYCFDRLMNHVSWLRKSLTESSALTDYYNVGYIDLMYYLAALAYDTSDAKRARELIDKMISLAPIDSSPHWYALMYDAYEANKASYENKETKAWFLRGMDGMKKVEQLISKMPEQQPHHYMDTYLRAARGMSSWDDINKKLDKWIKENSEKEALED